MVVTIKDVAKAAGVSFTTVSLAFQDGSRISGKQRKKILAIAKDLGYTPNRQAQALRTGKTRTIGIVVNDITNPFYASMIRAAQIAALKRGYEVVSTDTQFLSHREATEIHSLLHARVEGMLVCFGEKGKESSKLLADHGIPFLALDTFPENYKGPYLANDVAGAARIAVEHLLEVGCQRPVFLNGEKEAESFSAFILLKEAFLQAVREGGIEADDACTFYAGLDIDAGRSIMRQVRDRVPTVDGLLCANSLCAMGAMETAEELGMRIPHDLAVVGIDDLNVCALKNISLTTIRQPFEQMTTVAMDLLINSIEEGKMPDFRMALEPELVVRNSTRRER